MPPYDDASAAVNTQPLPPVPANTRIDFLSVLLALAKAKRRVLLMTFGGLLLGVLLSFIMKPTYIAAAAILLPQQASSAASLMGQLGAFSGASLSAGLGLKSPADMYIGILESDTIADRVIASCNLRQRYKTRTLVDTRVALQTHTIFESGKDGLIHLSVKDTDPNIASQIANRYLDQLYEVNSDLVTGEAAQRKNFYEHRLAEERQALAEAEVALRNTQQKTGVIQLSVQAASVINSIARTRAELASRQVALQSAQTYRTAENPEVMQLQHEIAALRANLAELEKNQQAVGAGPSDVPASLLPEAALQYERQARELKYHETLFDLLTRQSEAAKLDEAKSAPVLQVVDRATPPDRKSGPPRKLLTLSSAAFGFLLASVWTLLELFLQRLEAIPEQAKKLQEIRSALRF